MPVQSLAPAASPAALPSAQPAPAARPAVPLEPLTAALASGRARFGEAQVTRRGLAARGMRNLKAKAEVIFAAFPEVSVGSQGVAHSIGGLPFVELAVAGSGYLAACGKSPGRPLSPGIPVEVVTGICLGGSECVTGGTGDRAYPLTDSRVVFDLTDVIENVVTDDRLHVYEADTVRRIGSFIAALARLRRQAPVAVRAHIPVREYELYALSLYARGLLSAQACDSYRRAVRRRGAIVSARLRACIGPGVELTVVSPLAVLDGLDPYGVPPGDLARTLHAAARRQDQLWAGLLAGESPPSFKALIFAASVHAYLATARDAAGHGCQLLFVEDPVETRIYREALLAGGRTGVSVAGVPAIYLHPEAVVTRTAFDSPEHVLFNCRNGCDPGTIAAAMACYSDRAAWDPPPHSRWRPVIAAE